MTKKERQFLHRYPGLRLLRSLSLGYHLAPLQGFGNIRVELPDKFLRGDRRVVAAETE